MEHDYANAPCGEIDLEDEATSQSKASKVIGRETLAEIIFDSLRMELPDGVTRTPSGLGTSKSGKLSADQWNSTCVINMVVTLIRLWGEKDTNSRYYKMLDNFMDLVVATKIVNRRTLTPFYHQLYDTHIRRYLEQLLVLYPHVNLSPYQHISLHFKTQFEKMGPAPASRCYPEERENGYIQNITQNMKMGAG